MHGPTGHQLKIDQSCFLYLYTYKFGIDLDGDG